MTEAGFFAPDERVELLDGRIIWMIAKGTAHRSAVARTDYLFKKRLENRAWVSSYYHHLNLIYRKIIKLINQVVIEIQCY